MAVIIGDSNAVLKDLTMVVEDTVAQTRPQLHPLICNTMEEDGAYTKIAVAANVAFPRKFEAERSSQGKDVPIVINYDQETYELTIDINSDLLKNAKAYSYESLVREAAISAVLFPDYSASQLVINGSSTAGYDGVNFYGTTHKYAKTGSNTINNTVSATGTTVPQILADLTSALTKIRTFKDNAGRLLNPLAAMGADKLVLHCPVALEVIARQALNASMVPVTAPVTTSGTAAMPVSNNVLQGVATVFGDGYLDASSATTWYLHYVGMAQKPFVFIENYPIQVKVLGPGSEFEANFNKVRIAIKHRFVLGYYRFDRSVKVA